jgi:DNA-binding HxlR family transcriptional regulator
VGTIQDLLQEVPLQAVLRERVALAEQRYEHIAEENAELKERVRTLEKENSVLRSQVPTPQTGKFDEATNRVLIHFFRARDEMQDVGNAARSLQLEEGVLKYHLDELKGAGFATCTGGNYVYGHVYWGLTPAGRKYVVENRLV